jgi:transposase InsO family protein
MQNADDRREPTDQERARALFYAQEWLIPLLRLEAGELTARISELAEAEHEIPFSRRLKVSEATLWRLLKAYRQDGLQGLFRKPRRDAGRARILQSHILQRAIEIRRDLPSRSVARILKVLKREFPLEIGQVKPSTLARALARAGCPRVRRRRRASGPQKERHIHMKWELPLQLVQSDVCGDALWVTEKGEAVKAVLIAVLDHCSKRCLGGEWVLSANLPHLERIITICLLIYGVFDRLHVDNGAIFTSYLLKNICSELGISLKYSRAGYAAGKGGIERFFLTVEEDFIPEIGDSTRFTLAQLNQRWEAWLHDYHRTVHSATKEEPLERYERLMAEPRWPDPVKLREAALLREFRTVDKRFCTVRVRSMEFSVDPSLRGKRVQVRYDAFKLDEVLIYTEDGARKLQRARVQPEDAKPAPFLPAPPAHPTPKIDTLAPLIDEMQKGPHKDRRPPAKAKVPQASFPAFCRQIGQLLHRESNFDGLELSLLREHWDQYGPFTAKRVRQALEPLIGQVGRDLHLLEYLKTLVTAQLTSETE